MRKKNILSHLNEIGIIVKFLVLGGMVYQGILGVMANETSQQAQSGKQAGDQLTVETWNPRPSIVWERYKDISGVDVGVISQKATLYDDNLKMQFDTGTAFSDIVACRPFERSLALYTEGHIVNLNEYGLSTLLKDSKDGWETVQGERYCIPVSMTTTVFFYNKGIFDELGLEIPVTIDDFLQTLEAIQTDGRYFPIALGTQEVHRAGNHLFNLLGPSLWKSNQGREAVVKGQPESAREVLKQNFELMAEVRKFLPPGYKHINGATMEALFRHREAAILPAGSWQIPMFQKMGEDLGVFPSLKLDKDDKCTIVYRPGFGLGINRKTKNLESAVEFLRWNTTETFAQLFETQLPGHFSNASPYYPEPDKVQEYISNWFRDCNTTYFLADQGFKENTKTIHELIWSLSTKVLNAEMTTDEAYKTLASAMDDALPGE